MNIIKLFGKLPDSNAGKGKLDWNGFLKVVRLACITAAAAFIAYVITNIVNVDVIPTSTIDETVIQLFLIPLLEMARRTVADYQQPTG